MASEPVALGDSASGPVTFIVAVVAPTRSALGSRRQQGGYGPAATDWRPYADLVLSAAALVEDAVQRLGMSARAADLDDVRPLLDESPGIVLVDPWVTTLPGESGIGRLAGLPDWILSVILTDHSDPQFHSDGEALTRNLVEILTSMGVARLVSIDDGTEFSYQVARLVLTAHQRFLRNVARLMASQGSTVPRPRLAN